MYKTQQDSENVNSNGGISLIGTLLRNVKSLMKFDKMAFYKIKKGINNHSGILRNIIGMFSLVRTDFADIKLFREDKLFCDCLDLSFVPFRDILRQRLDGIAADDNTLKLIDDANVDGNRRRIDRRHQAMCIFDAVFYESLTGGENTRQKIDAETWFYGSENDCKA
jgi:hypothetical protein